MNIRIIPALICAIASGMNPTYASAESDSLAMIVNGKSATMASLQLLLTSRSERGQEVDETLREEMKQELITRLVLSQEAQKQGLDKDSHVRAQQELNELSVLSQAYLRDYAEKLSVSENELKEEYKKYLGNYNAQEFHVRQILVKNQVTAEEMIAQLKEGADFAELAKQNSIDPGATNTGGDIGWFRPDVFIDKSLSNAVKKLKRGEYSHEPVQTRFGWHVIKIEEGPRKVKFPDYDQLSEEWKKKIHDQAVMSKVNKHVLSLVGSANVELLGLSGDNLAMTKITNKDGGNK